MDFSPHPPISTPEFLISDTILSLKEFLIFLRNSYYLFTTKMTSNKSMIVLRLKEKNMGKVLEKINLCYCCSCFLQNKVNLISKIERFEEALP
jgi:hypothetical protein